MQTQPLPGIDDAANDRKPKTSLDRALGRC